MLRRHEALRTTFALVQKRLVQIIASFLHLTLKIEDLCALPETKQEVEIQRLTREEADRPFNLTHGPHLLGHLLLLREQEHRLLVTLHHIISDDWSLSVFVHELAVLYDAFSVSSPSPLPTLPIQYANFAHWQHQGRHSTATQTQLAYWQEQLRDPLPILELPTDRPQGKATSFHAARQALVVPEALSEGLKNLSRREGSTLFMTFVAACKMLLYGYTGQADLRVATLIANRMRQE